MIRVGIICLFAQFLLSGCLYTLVEVGDTEPGTMTEKSVAAFFTSKVVKEIPVDCPKGIHKIEEGAKFGDGFMTGLTLGFMRWRTTRVICAK